MKKKKQLSAIMIPAGYELEEMMDTDDSGYAFEDPLLIEEVIIEFERGEE